MIFLTNLRNPTDPTRTYATARYAQPTYVGYVADISQNTSASTSTPYLFAAICRMVYLRGGETEFSFARERVPTYAPNFLTSADTTVQEGTPIFGILWPTFGGYTRATCATWEKGTIAGWRSEGLCPSVFTSDVGMGPWSRAPLPSIGASGFFTKKTSPRITGLRIKPPTLEVREYNDKMSKNFRDSATPSVFHLTWPNIL